MSPPAPHPDVSQAGVLSDRDWLDKFCNVNDMDLVDVAAGSDSFFLALQHGMIKAGIANLTVQQLRDYASNEMRAHPERYHAIFPIITADEVKHHLFGPGVTFKQYVAKTREHEWASELTIMAICNALGIRIYVWQLQSGHHNLRQFNDGPSVTLTYLVDEAHYMCLVPRIATDEPSEAPVSSPTPVPSVSQAGTSTSVQVTPPVVAVIPDSVAENVSPAGTSATAIVQQPPEAIPVSNLSKTLLMICDMFKFILLFFTDSCFGQFPHAVCSL